MYALWIGETQYTGNIRNRKIAIEKGHIRKVHAKDGDMYVLDGFGGSKAFGWVEGENLIIANTKEELEKIQWESQ